MAAPSLDGYLLFKKIFGEFCLENRLVLFYLVFATHKYENYERSMHGDALNIEETNDYDATISILILWMDCFLSSLSSDQNMKLLNESIDACFIRPQNWRELIRLCDLTYQIANIKESIFQKLLTANLPIEISDKLKDQLDDFYSKLIEVMTIQLMIDLKSLDTKKNTYLVQELTQVNLQERRFKINRGSLFSGLNSDDEPSSINLNKDEVEEYGLNSLAFISDLATYMPRIKSSLNKRSRIAKECALRINPFDDSNIILKRLNSQSPDPPNDLLLKQKIVSYNHYRKILTALSTYNQDLKRMNNVETNPRIKLHLARRDLSMIKKLLDAPISESILNPVPEPVDASTFEQISPLYEWLLKQETVFFSDLKFIEI